MRVCTYPSRDIFYAVLFNYGCVSRIIIVIFIVDYIIYCIVLLYGKLDYWQRVTVVK